MKKMFSIVMMALLVISLAPAALAERGGAGMQAQAGQDEPNQYQERMQQQVQQGKTAQARTQAGMREGMPEALPVQAKTRAREMFQEARKRFESAREHFKQVRERLRQEKGNYDEAKKRVREIKGELEECRGKRTTNCKAARVEARAHAQVFLKQSGKKVDNALQRAISAVEKSKLSEEKQQELINELKAKVQAAEQAQAKAEELDEDSTTEEIQAVRDEIKEAWTNARETIKQTMNEITAERMGGVIQRTQALEQKLDRFMERAREQGRDLGQIDLLVDKFDEQINLASQKHQQVQGLAAEGNRREGAQKLQEAQRHLREAHRKLMEIVSKLRGEAPQMGNSTGPTQAEQTKVEIEGSLNEETVDLVDRIAISLENVEHKVKLSLKTEAEGNQTKVKAETEGELTPDQQALWEQLQEMVKGQGEIELEIEHEA